MKTIAKFILHTLLGWKIIGNFPKDLKKYVIIAAPHTHWLDFPLGVLTKYATGTTINYIGNYTAGVSGVYFDNSYVFVSTSHLPYNSIGPFSRTDVDVLSDESFLLLVE